MVDETAERVIALLTEDVQKHREYIQKMYLGALGLLLPVFAAVIWFTGNRLETDFINHLLDQEVQGQIDGLIEQQSGFYVSRQVESILEDEREAFANEVQNQASAAERTLAVKVAELVDQQAFEAVNRRLNDINDAQVRQELMAFTIPVGSVVPFNLETCPTGWREYTPAYGRFIRGIDRSTDTIDPMGERLPGSLQEDELKAHTHRFGWSTNITNGSDGSGEQVGAPNPGLNRDTSPAGGPETRPKNVALLFCIKEQINLTRQG